MKPNRLCPALFISAPASGHGKTLVTAAIAHYHTLRGRKVRVFKTGADCLDPKIFEIASRHPVQHLDLWMVGESHCQRLLWEAAGDADLILIEGAMGLFDGDHSSAELASLFSIPVMVVIDGSAMAQTFGALTYGLASYQPDLPFYGVFANKISSTAHYDMLLDSLPSDTRSCGRLPTLTALAEHHVGLAQASEVDNLNAHLKTASEALNDFTDALPAPVTFSAELPDGAF